MYTDAELRISSEADLATWRADAVTAVLGVGLVGGVYLDGWAHLHRPGLESFFTPWHGVLYGGFLALAAWLVAVTVRRRAVPAGYGLGLVGVAVFGAGGLGDMLWHQIFGIEVGLDALLSPTHLVLLAGGVLMLTTPLRSATTPGAVRSSYWAVLPTILSVAATAALAGFFLAYLSVFADTAARVAPTHIPEGAPGHRQAENFTIVGLGEYLTTTILVLTAVLVVYRCYGRVPAGLTTAVVAAVAVGGGVLTEFAGAAALIGAVLGAVAADIVLHVAAVWRARNTAVAVGVVLPALVWAGQLVGLAVGGSVAWTVELWAGVVILTAMAGGLLGSLTVPREQLGGTG